MIKDVRGFEVLDSRGNPTVACKLVTDKGSVMACCPSGASTGKHEAKELRDGGERYFGKGVLKAVENINTIIKQAFVGKEESAWEELDKLLVELDGTPDKSRLGANATTAVSMACVKAAALADECDVYQVFNKKAILPVPMFNVLNGGEHAGNGLAVQEFLFVPHGASTFHEALMWVSMLYHQLKKDIEAKYGKTAINVGDEGGFAPPLSKTSDALELLAKAIEELGLKGKVSLAFDAAASTFFNGEDNTYSIDGKVMSADQLLDHYVEFLNTFPIVSVEDPFDEEAFDDFAAFTSKVGAKVQVIGDDLITTNPKRVKIAIEKKSINAALIKINQIGTVSEACEVIEMAKQQGWNTIVSHRSGETCDNFIADFAVGTVAGQIKSGSTARSERLAKYNRLLLIEDERRVQFNKTLRFGKGD